MAIDFDKYGTATKPTGKIDFNKYGLDIEPITPQESTGFRYDVLDTTQSKVVKAKEIASQAKEEAKKANSFVERYVKPVASILPGVADLGETIAGIGNTNQLTKSYMTTVNTVSRTLLDIQNKIKAYEKLGKDTSELKRIYNSNADFLDQINNDYREATAGATKSTKKVVGELGLTALNLLTAGTYKGATALTKPTLATTAVQRLMKPISLFSRQGLTDIALGAGVGEAYDIAQNLTEEKTGGNVFTDGYAKYIGAGIPAVIGGTGSIRNFFSPSKNYEKYGETLRETFNKYVKTQSLLQNAETRNGTSPIDVLVQYGKNTIPEMQGGKVNPTNSIEFLDQKISQLSTLKREGLFLNDNRIPIADYRQYGEDLIDSMNSWSVGKKLQEKANFNKIADDLETAYKDSPKNQGGLELLDWDTIKTEQTGLSKSYKNKNPTFSYDSHGIAGKAARDLIELYTDDVGIKELNKFIQSHYDAIDLLLGLRGKAPSGGALSKAFYKLGGDVIGAVAGHSVGQPVIGGVAGHLIANKIADIVQSSFISNPVKRILIQNLKEQSPRQVEQAMKVIEKKYGEAFQDLFPTSQIMTSPTTNATKTANMIGISDTIPQEFERAKNLSDADRIIEDRAFDKISKNEEEILAQYEAKNGKVLNTDNFRPFFKEEGYKGYNAASVQEPSSYLTKKLFAKWLKNVGDIVVFMAGGSGTGKSSAVNNSSKLKKTLEDSAFIFDGNLSSYNSAIKKLNQVKEAGKTPIIVYVYRDPIESFANGVVKRMKENPEEMGRLVPSNVVAENHIGSWETAKRLAKEGFKVKVIDNSLGGGKAKVSTLAELEKKIKYPPIEKLTELFNNKAKELYEGGRITKEEYGGYIGK